MPEKLYTLEEARAVLTEEVCAKRGHDYEIVVNGGANAPSAVLCLRCGKRWECLHYA